MSDEESKAYCTKERYDAWIHPAHALARFPNDKQEAAKDVLIGRLRSGVLMAMAKQAKPLTDSSVEMDPYPLVDKRAFGYADDRFWLAGDLTVPLAALTGEHWQSAFAWDLLGIRLRPADLDEIGVAQAPTPNARSRQISQAPPPMTPIQHSYVAKSRDAPLEDELTAASKKPTKGPVRPAEFDAWYGGLSPLDQARDHRWLTDEAKKYFQGRRGLKAFIDAQTKGRPRGRPRKAS